MPKVGTTFLVAAYSDTGLSVTSLSLNGILVFAPYTDDDSAKTTRLILACRADSKILIVPSVFERSYAHGFTSEYRTPACAAECTITSGRVDSTNARRGIVVSKINLVELIVFESRKKLIAFVFKQRVVVVVE